MATGTPGITTKVIDDRLESFIKDYRDDEGQPLPQTVAVAAMTALKAGWGNGPFDFKQMDKDMDRLLQILAAFRGQVVIADWLVNGPPPDDDD